MEPIGNLANVEELDLKTRQRTGRAEVRAWMLFWHRQKSHHVVKQSVMLCTVHCSVTCDM